MSVQVEVEGGAPPYEWSIEDDTCGLSLQRDDGASTELTGAPAQPGDCAIVVGVSDSVGSSGRLTVPVEVYDAPRLLVGELDSACLSEIVTTTLGADGGESASYEFHVESQGNGSFRIIGEQLLGVIQSPESGAPPESISLALWVGDGRCESAREERTIAIERAESERCPQIPKTTEPPRPCAGQPYETTLTIDANGYSWESALELPAGLTFEPKAGDPSKAVLSGVPDWVGEEEHAIELAIASDDGRRFVRTASLTPRDRCWFGYVSAQDGSWQFHLYDPVLRTRRSFSAPHAAPVVGFRFSPNGEFVAYAAGAAGGRTELTLVHLSTLNQQLLTFDGSVTQYAWSPTGSVLSVVFRSASDETFLSGADVSAVQKNARYQGVAEIPEVVLLRRTPAAVVSEPVWYGDDRLAYQVDAGLGSLLGWPIEYTRVLNGSFDLPRGFGSFYGPSARLIGSGVGLLVNDASGDGSFLDFIALRDSEEPALIVHNPSAGTAASPGGAYIGRPRAGTLEIFRAETGELEQTAFTSLEGEQCGALLAWAKSVERIACVTSVEGGGEVRVYDLKPDEAPALQMHRLDHNYAYAMNDSIGQRRIFSPSGRYFAFTTRKSLYVADLVDWRTLRSYAQVEPPGASQAAGPDPVDLAFSADERFLIQHRRESIRLYDLAVLTERGTPLSFGDDMPSANGCAESYVGSGGAWCGEASPPKSFRWSPTSPFVSVLTGEGRLWVLEVISARDIREQNLNSGCLTDCVRGFSFQP